MSVIPAAVSGDGDVSGAIGKLSSAADRSAKTGQSLATQGADLLGPIQEYLKAVTGGDRQALMQATMPERRRVIDQYATAKKAIAEFTPRGGGQAGAMAQLQGQQAGDLAETTATARQKGITTAGTLGGQLTTLGLSADALASGDLNSIINALTKQDETKSDKWAAIGQGLGTMAGYYFGRGA